MKRKKPTLLPKHATMNKRPYQEIDLTYKQALGILHRMSWEYLKDISPERYEQQKSLLFDAHDALRVLAVAVLGAPGFPQYSSLCWYCHEAYSEHFVQEKGPDDGIRSLPPPSHGCCEPCRDRLATEGKLLLTDDASDVAQPDTASAPPQDEENIPQ
jgi:hypothetical protein